MASLKKKMKGDEKFIGKSVIYGKNNKICIVAVYVNFTILVEVPTAKTVWVVENEKISKK